MGILAFFKFHDSKITHVNSKLEQYVEFYRKKWRNAEKACDDKDAEIDKWKNKFDKLQEKFVKLKLKFVEKEASGDKPGASLRKKGEKQ